MRKTFSITPCSSVANKACYWFVLNQDHELLLTRNGDRYTIPYGTKPPVAQDLVGGKRCIGIYDEKPCISISLNGNDTAQTPLTPLPLRQALPLIDDDLWIIAGRASQIQRWEEDNRFCGRCGEMMRERDELSMHCSSCNHSVYPRISPCVIMSVIRDDEILLGRSPHFPEGMYSTLAGFVEPGETLEEAVAREIREEAGIEVSDIEYKGSQVWPFPHQLMVGFTARYRSGKLRINEAELEDAGWFRRDEMPKLPFQLTIARRLIDMFVEGG